MQKKYRLEFSEDQQWLRMDNYSYPAATNGFITIKDPCTDNECNIFKCFLYRNEKDFVLRDKEVKYRNADVLEAMQELDGFLKNLNEFKFDVKRQIRSLLESD